MIAPSHSSPVPPFHSLESGTVEQTLNQRNSPRNVNGTCSLKALANKVMERNKKGNKPGTAASKSVPLMTQSSSACGTDKFEMDANMSGLSVPSYGVEQKPSFDSVKSDELLSSFEERLAIAEYDGHQNTIQAERIAYLDAFLSILFDLTALDPQRDWLVQKVQAALTALEAQQFPIQH